MNFLVRGNDNHLISTPAATVVATSAYAQVAAWLVAAAFALLVVLVINNIRRQMRRRRRAAMGDTNGADFDGHQPATEVEP